ncbi:ABC transporter ATP-binding protein [Bacillus sp. 8YEL33]|uniref:ATP-binding cassette domain-containing protein n=1 Tax=Bacillus TaxID=1386 RepID=UPI0018A17F21|nr:MULTISPECIES: ABC transporter ATP-binding protein [Bacillus]MBF7150675.1 ABC transporter ATP-binding protein [Bacillus toyonensis]MBY7104971.1 ABC transporter ATP-binding protein [Bacillus sp. 6YEL31]MBY7131318.1 ABC transporter ATP-binding protein [Bacillus sp. 8YEL33]MEC2348185.1 ABC transporter ATP-binding protein [Bacillus toyonensis]MED3188640.1 ABC transporter ATP-binding protein [Bacillus toyonensis]
MSNNIISVKNLIKSFDNKIVLDKLNFEMKKNSTVVIIGKNGAGKSVFLNCLLGFIHYNQGSILIDGQPVENRLHLRKITSLISSDHQEHLNLLTPNEYFSFLQDIYQIKSNNKEKIQNYSEDLYVTKELNTVFSSLSFGTKKKIQLIGSLLYSPKLLICDEIFEGLDTDSVKWVKNLFQQRKQENLSTLFTTHITEHITDITEKNYILENGKLIEN